MKKMMTLLAVTALVGVFAVPAAYSQRGPQGRGGGGWGAGSKYNRLYDAKTVETVSGEVLTVDKMVPSKGMSNGVHLELKTDKGTVSVHLGPAWFIENQDLTIEPKDKIEIKGSRVTYEGKPAIIAAEVKKGDSVLSSATKTASPFGRVGGDAEREQPERARAGPQPSFPAKKRT
jgi:hypothetical protein